MVCHCVLWQGLTRELWGGWGEAVFVSFALAHYVVFGSDYNVEQTNKKMIKTESVNVTKEETFHSSRQQSSTNMTNTTKTCIICGTSGYSYSHWKGKYYPKGMGGSSTKQWHYYSTEFGAVELNGTHYKWHKKETWESWKENACQASGGNCSCHKNDFTIAGDDDDGMQWLPLSSLSLSCCCFIYAIKANQYFTQWKQLNVDEQFIEKLQSFVDHCCVMGPHLSPILFQCLGHFVCNDVNLARLEQFGQLMQCMGTQVQQTYPKIIVWWNVVLEFHHPSWFVPIVYWIMQQYNLCLCHVHITNPSSPHKPWASGMPNGFSPPFFSSSSSSSGVVAALSDKEQYHWVMSLRHFP